MILMPRFFFDVDDGVVYKDDVGVELPTAESLPDEAMRFLVDLARHERPKGAPDRSITVVVRDHTSRPVYTCTLNLIGLYLPQW